MIIVDDVLTTGSSILSAAEAVEELEAQVSAVYVLVDRGEGGREALQQAGYPGGSNSRLELEQLQQQLESRYPPCLRHCRTTIPGGNKYWRELEARHDYLVGPLTAGEQLGRAGEQGTWRRSVKKESPTNPGGD